MIVYLRGVTTKRVINAMLDTFEEQIATCREIADTSPDAETYDELMIQISTVALVLSEQVNYLHREGMSILERLDHMAVRQYTADDEPETKGN